MNNIDEPNDEVIEGTYGGPYMVEQIIAIYVGKDRKKYYRVKWVDSWEPEDNLSEACSALIDNFWSSSARDQTGKEVNRTELKAGQKIIKKEIIESRANNENSNPDSATEGYIGNNKVVPTLKSDLSSPKDDLNLQVSSTSNDKIKNLKQELMSPTSGTLPTDKSKSVPPDLSEIQQEQSNSKSNTYPKQHVEKVDSSTQNNLLKTTKVNTTTSTQSTNNNNNEKQHNKSPKRRSVECQTQTDPYINDVMEFEDSPQIVSPNQHRSVSIGTDSTEIISITQRSTTNVNTELINNNRQPLPDLEDSIVNFQDGRMGNQESYSSQQFDDEPGFLGEPNYQNQQSVNQSNNPSQQSVNQSNNPGQQSIHDQNYQVNQGVIDPNYPDRQSIDASDEQSIDESDVVDLASEEDELVITFSLSTPPNKRQCLEKQKQKQHPASTSRLEKRTREKITMRRRRNNSDSERNTTVNTVNPNNVALLHPRSLLSMYPNGQQPPVNQGPNVLNTASNPPQLASQPNHQTISLRGTLNPTTNTATGNLQSQNLLPRGNTNTTAKLTDRTCNICKHTFPNLTSARQHMKKMHNPASTVTKQTNLQTRNINNPNNTAIQSPQQRTTPTRSVVSPSKELSCSVCFGLFRNNRDLKSHMLLHTEKNMHQCKICLKAFRSKSTLTQHMLIHTQEMPWECETCGKKFRQQGHLITHMGKHTQNSEGSLHCPYCILIIKDINEFRNHVRSHEQELPFKCSQCSERFQKRQDLSTHLDAHNEGRPFTCLICKKSFKTKPYLFGHMQMHKTNEASQQPKQNVSQQNNRQIQQTNPPHTQQSRYQAKQPTQQFNHPKQQLSRNQTSPMQLIQPTQQILRHPQQNLGQQQQVSNNTNNNDSLQNKLLNPSQRLQQQRNNSQTNPTQPPVTVSVKTQSES